MSNGEANIAQAIISESCCSDSVKAMEESVAGNGFRVYALRVVPREGKVDRTRVVPLVPPKVAKSSRPKMLWF